MVSHSKCQKGQIWAFVIYLHQHETHIVSHIWYFSWPHDLWPWVTFKGQMKYNWICNGLYLLNGACYDQSLHAMHIVSHIYGLSVDLMIFDLGWTMTFKGQIKVFECLVGCISWIVHVIIWICVNNEQIWLPGNCGSDFEKYLNRLQLDPLSLLVNFSHELAHIMTPYDFLSAKQAILSNRL